MRTRKFLNMFGGLMAMLVLATACATEVGDIDRTDPNKIRKTDLHGIWFIDHTVVEAPVPSPLTFNGEQAFGGGASIIFDIQEDWLIAYPISELYVHSSEKDWKKAKIRNYWEPGKSDEFMEIYVGQPVAAYRIMSHFDVKREYNTSTGSQSNVISENTSDRPWYERDYIRVDWSNNSVRNLMFLAGTMGSPVDYYVQEFEEDDPDRFYMGESAFHFVNKLFLEPVSPYSCSVYDVAPYDCAGAVVKVRTAFKRKDPNNEYVPINYDNMTYEERYGFFLTSRNGYDVNKGILYADKQFFANRWDLWKNSRSNEPILDEGKQVTCRLDTDCEGYHNGQVHCRLDDGWFTEGVCVTWDPLPFKDREPMPIVYHVSGHWPKQMWDVPYRTADAWSKTFKETVAWLKLYSEAGFYDIKYCKSHDDCAGSTKPIFDLNLADEQDRRCSTDAECRTGINSALQPLYSCGTDGFCGKVSPCSETQACPLGQACYDGVCKECPDGQCVQANQWATVKTKVKDKGNFTLVYKQVATGPAYDLTVDGPIPFLANNEVRVLFYHLNGFVENVKLIDAGGSICKTEAGNDASYAFQGGVPLVRPSGCLLTISGEQVRDLKVVDAADPTKVLAEIPSVTFEGGDVHTIIFGGDEKRPLAAHSAVAYADFAATGIRFAHLAAGEGAVDFAVNGGLRSSDITAGTITGYTGMTQLENRVLVVKAGGNTEYTCYFDVGDLGMCTGWRPDFTEEHMARYQEIFDSLPEMFVSCENQYTGDLCTEAQRGDMTLLNDCRYWHQDANGQWSNPCGEVEDAKKLKLHGDTRFNQFYWVSEDQTSSPLGYGPSSADPDSGHIYYGIANIYGAAMISYGQYAVDLLRASIGDLTKEDLMTSKYVAEFVKGRDQRGTSESLYAPMEVDREELDRRKANVEIERFWLEPEERASVRGMFADPKMVRTMFHPKDFSKLVTKSLPPSMGGEELDARFQAVKGTHIEGLLKTKEVQAAFNDPNTGELLQLNGTYSDDSSPLAWASGEARRSFKDKATLCERGGYFSQELVEPYIYGTAKRIKDWCADEDNWDTFTVPYTSAEDCMMWQITREILYGVLEHEVGHTVGLRHNFTASTDIFNYQTDYYGKRTKEYRRCYLQGPDGCAFGDYCRISCTTNDDCKLPGTTCEDVVVEGKDMRACVDSHLTPTGVCWGKRATRTDCKGDVDCVALGAGARCDRKPDQITGYCAAPVKPNNGLCPSGMKVEGDICAKQDTCDTEAGRCKVDGSRTCKADLDCKVKYQIFEVEDAEEKPLLMFVPRGPLYDEEVKNSRNEYQYSSLMDYGGTINFDLQELGKYDEAAIRFGYGELIDVYTDTSNLEPAMKRVADYYGFDPIYLSFLMDTEVFTSLIFSPWLMLNDFIGVEQNLKRIPAPFRKVQLERKALESNDRGVWDMTYRVTPYKYAGDEWRGNWETYVFDVGADVGEIVEHSLNKLEEYYVFDAFKRERWGAYRNANPVGYYNRILDRWFPPLQDAGRFFAIYYNVFRPWPSYRKQVLGDVMRLGYMKEIAEHSLKKLFGMLFSPAPGSYMLADEGLPTERYVNIDYDMGAAGSQLDIPIGQAKYPYTTYWRDAGYYYFNHAHFVGSFWEKVAALNTMTYSLGYFIGSYIGEQVPVGVATSIGFNTNFFTELTNSLGGFLVGNADMYRPYIDDAGRMHTMDPSRPWEAEGKRRVETSVEGESMRAYVGLFAYSYLPSGFDQGFQDSMFLCLEGSGNCYDIDQTDFFGDGAGIEVASYTDPWSKKTYIAKKVNYDTKRLSPAYWLVERANSVLSQWEASDDDSQEKELLAKELRGIVENLDLVLSFNELYGNMTY